MSVQNDYLSILQAIGVDSAYLRAMSAANGSYTALSIGTTVKNFRTFTSNGSAVVTALWAVPIGVPTDKATAKDVTNQVISGASALPSGTIYTMGDGWMFTSITTSAGVVTLYY